jgi:hypothetical protein
VNPQRRCVPEIVPRPRSAKTGSMPIVGGDEASAATSHALGQIAVTCERYVNREGERSKHDEGRQSVAGSASAGLANTCEREVECDYGPFGQRRGLRPDSLRCTAPRVSGSRGPCGRRNHGRSSGHV